MIGRLAERFASWESFLAVMALALLAYAALAVPNFTSAFNLSQAAAGSDLLFLESCLARGVHCRVLLPLPVADFVAQSVLPSVDGVRWRARFESVQARLAEPMQVMDEVLGPTPPGGNRWVRATDWLLSSAFAHGPAKVCLVCVWDGRDGDGPGGTGHMVHEVSRRGGSVRRIDIDRLLKSPGAGAHP